MNSSEFNNKILSLAIVHFNKKAFVRNNPNFLFSGKKLYLPSVNEIKNLIINQPEGAFYIFPNIKNYIGKSHKNITINNSDNLSMFLLEDAGVSTVSGSAFGANNYIRISYAASEKELMKACELIKKSLNKLQ